MRRKTGEVVLPVRRHAHGGIIEAGPGRRVERPRQPIAEQNRAKSDPLPARAAEREQNRERIAQANLRERVFKGEIGLRAVSGSQKYPQRHQQERSPERVRNQHA